MTVDRHFLRFTLKEPVRTRFEGAVVMRVVDHPFRVDIAGLNTQLQRTLRHRTDITDIPARSEQRATNAIGFSAARSLLHLQSRRRSAAVRRCASNQPADKTTVSACSRHPPTANSLAPELPLCHALNCGFTL